MVKWTRIHDTYKVCLIGGGDIRLAVFYKEGWVADATWLGRSGYNFQTLVATEDEATAAAIGKAAEWLRAERATIDAALAELGA